MSSDITHATHPAHLREGDLIFSRIPNAVYRRIAEATGSPRPQ